MGRTVGSSLSDSCSDLTTGRQCPFTSSCTSLSLSLKLHLPCSCSHACSSPHACASPTSIFRTSNCLCALADLKSWTRVRKESVSWESWARVMLLHWSCWTPCCRLRWRVWILEVRGRLVGCIMAQRYACMELRTAFRDWRGFIKAVRGTLVEHRRFCRTLGRKTVPMEAVVLAAR